MSMSHCVGALYAADYWIEYGIDQAHVAPFGDKSSSGLLVDQLSVSPNIDVISSYNPKNTN